jgi:hypothetical protein
MGTAAQPRVSSIGLVADGNVRLSPYHGGRPPLPRLSSSTPAHLVGVCLVALPPGRAA